MSVPVKCSDILLVHLIVIVTVVQNQNIQQLTVTSLQADLTAHCWV